MNKNSFDDHEISVDPFVYICDVAFEIRAREERHVIDTRGNSRLNKGQTFIKQAIPLKNVLTCWSTDISKLCRTRHFHCKVCICNSYRMIKIFVATGSRWRRSGAVRVHTLSLPRTHIFATWVEATAILATKITWWHGNMIVCALLSRRGAITQAAPSWSPGTARQHPREFHTNNTHTIMFDPFNIAPMFYDAMWRHSATSSQNTTLYMHVSWSNLIRHSSVKIKIHFLFIPITWPLSKNNTREMIGSVQIN